MWNEVNTMGWGWMGLGAIHMLLFWGFLILGIGILVRFISADPDVRRDPEPKSALEVLKTRYTRGEIDRNEFEEKKLDLQD